MRARNLILCGVLATTPLGLAAHAAFDLNSAPATRAAGPASAVLQAPSKENLTSVAFNERSSVRAQPPVSDPSYTPQTSKPLNRSSLDKGLLLLLLAALVTHQLRRNQRLLSRQLTGT
jgi:hypothetical protein